jgi:hypothetical protein
MPPPGPPPLVLRIISPTIVHSPSITVLFIRRSGVKNPASCHCCMTLASKGPCVFPAGSMYDHSTVFKSRGRAIETLAAVGNSV